MSPNSEENGPRLSAVQDGGWATDIVEKDQLRPPTYNPEDYALSLRKWGRRANGGSQQSLYGTPALPEPVDNKGKGLMQALNIGNQNQDTASTASGSRSSRGGHRDYKCPIIPPAVNGEMSLRQFSSASELLGKLKADLKLSFPSFVQEFVGDPMDGVTLLLELLRAVQLSQANQTTTRCPPSVLRRALLDENACLQCLKHCLRCTDATRRLAASSAGLFTLAVCIMSNVTKSRVIALELLSRVCEPPGNGHSAVSEALSTLRLRFGEPVRFRFLVGMLSSAGGSPDLQAAGLRFINSFLRSAPEHQRKLYIQAELEQAGFQPGILKKVLGSNNSAADQVRIEISHWEKNYIDVDALKSSAEAAEKENSTLKEKVSVLEKKIKILQEEKEVFTSIEKCLKERCFELEEENSCLRGGKQITNKQHHSLLIVNADKTSSQLGGSTPAEDEGISSSEQDHSLSSHDEDTGDTDIEREPLVYEMLAVKNDTIMIEQNKRKEGVSNLPEMKVSSVDDEVDDDDETTIDEVIEELRNIINDAETETCADEDVKLKEEHKQKEVFQEKGTKWPKNHSKHYSNRQKVYNTIDSISNPAKEPGFKCISVDIRTRDAELEIIPTRILPQPPRRSRSLVHLVFNGRGCRDDDVETREGSLFFDDESPNHSISDEEPLCNFNMRENIKSYNTIHPQEIVPNNYLNSLKVFDESNAAKYQINKGNMNNSSKIQSINNRNINGKDIKHMKTSQNVVIKRSDSFHHLNHDEGVMKLNNLNSDSSNRSYDDMKSVKCSGGPPIKNNFDAFYYMNMSNTANDVKRNLIDTNTYKIRSEEVSKEEQQRKLKAKSLDRIDEGLDSLVDIVVMTPNMARSRISSGGGSAEDWNVDWGEEMRVSRNRRSIAESGLPSSIDSHPVVIVSRNSASHQRSSPIQSEIRQYQQNRITRTKRPDERPPNIPRSKRYPPDGSSNPTFSINKGITCETNSSVIIPTSPSSSVNSKTFVLKRGNAGLYSGQQISSNIKTSHIYTPPPDYKISSSPHSTRSSLITIGKVTDIPSGLY